MTLIDAATRRPIATRPLGARVRWLSNEQPYWDGQHVWTYDFPDDRLQAIAIEPREVAVARTIPDIGRGPGHSLVVLPGGKKALLNVAGDNFAQLFDARTHQEVRRLEVGPGGANFGFTCDGTQAVIALTGANAVTAIDVARLDVVERIPTGSQPTGLIVR